MAAAVVFSKSAQAASSTTVTTASIDSTGSDAIIVHVGNNGIAHTSVTDNKSNTYTAVTGTSNTTSTERTAIYRCDNPTVGTGHTFTYTIGTAQFPSISAQGFSGLDDPIADVNGTNNTDTTTPYNTTSDPVPSSGQRLLTVVAVHGGATTSWVAGTSYTLVASGTSPATGSGIETNSANMPIGVNYREVTGNGSTAFDGEIRCVSASACMSMGVFKVLGGAAQDTPELRGRPNGLRGQQQMQQVLAQ
jgi:hypothetical protein